MRLELRVPPLGLALILAAAMYGVAEVSPRLLWTAPWGSFLGLALGVVGGAVAAAGVVEFRRARTTVNPLHPEAASGLVTSGVYRFSRNPMYLGFLLALTGWASYLAAPFTALLLPAFVVYLNRYQIAPEERALQQRFGADFERYRRQVRRWL